MEFEKFELLGQKVDELLSRLTALSNDRRDLSEQLVEKQEDIDRLKEKLAVFEAERKQILTKVNDLLEHIDEFDQA